MLLRQNGRGRQQSDLFAAFDGEKRRSHGYFSLAKANVAADQAIHRFLAMHARKGFIDGALLIGCFFVFESGFEFFVHSIRWRKGGAGARLAHRV